MQDDLEDLIRELNASAAPPDTQAAAGSAPATSPLAPRAAGDDPPLWSPGGESVGSTPRSTSALSAASSSSARLESWLAVMMERRASDLLLVSGAPPVLRVDGRVAPIEGALSDAGPLDGLDIEEAVYPALAPHAQKQYRETGIADASFRLRGLGRFRINLHHERGRAAATIRALPASVPRLASLGLPAGVELLSKLARGLVLIGGPHRIGQVDDAGGAGGGDQSPRGAAHHHHRGSDRVRARAQAVDRRAGGDRRRRARLSDGAARRVAPGARRDRRRRDARSRDDEDRAGRGRDGASRAVEHPHDGHRVDGVAGVGLVSGRTAEHDPAGTLDGAGRGDDADAAAEDRRRPRGGGRDCCWSATARVSTSGRTRCSTCTRRSRSPASSGPSASRSRSRGWCAKAWSNAARHRPGRSTRTNSKMPCGRPPDGPPGFEIVGRANERSPAAPSGHSVKPVDVPIGNTCVMCMDGLNMSLSCD